MGAHTIGHDASGDGHIGNMGGRDLEKLMKANKMSI